jgi:hypothetical protein
VGSAGFLRSPPPGLRDTRGIAVVTISPGAVDTPIYRHSANYIGRQIRPLPPVMSADRVVAAVVRALHHPRAEIIVGQTHRVGAWAHQLVPRLYDRLVEPIIHYGALRNAPADPNNGNGVHCGSAEQRDRRWVAQARSPCRQQDAHVALGLGAATTAACRTRLERARSGNGRWEGRQTRHRTHGTAPRHRLRAVANR